MAAAGGVPAAGLEALQCLHKQARLLSKQFLHESAVAVASTAVAMTHGYSHLQCPHVGLYLEACFLYGTMLADAKQYKRAACAFLRLADLLQQCEAPGAAPGAYTTGAVASRGLPNFANHPYVLYKAARCHFALDDHSGGYEILRKVPFRQRTVAIHYDLGREYQRRGVRQHAVASFREVLRANPFAVELIGPILRMGMGEADLLALLGGVLPPLHGDWVLELVRAEAAAASAQYGRAVNTLVTLMVGHSDSDGGVRAGGAEAAALAPAGMPLLPATPLPTDAVRGVTALHCDASEVPKPSVQRNVGVMLSAPPTAAAPFLPSGLPLLSRPGARLATASARAEAVQASAVTDSAEEPSVVAFPSGHPYLLRRLLTVLADADAVADALRLYGALALADPLAPQGVEDLAYALARGVQHAALHGSGASIVQTATQVLGKLVHVLSGQRHAVASWAVAALAAWCQGDTHNAVRFVNTGMQCDAHHELCMTVKGHVLMDMGNFHAAANHFFTSSTRSASLHCVAGVVRSYCKLKLWAQALAHAGTAVHHNPQDARAYLLLGDAILAAVQSGEELKVQELARDYHIDATFAGAAGAFGKALTLAPGHPNGVAGLATAKYEDGDAEGALKLLREHGCAAVYNDFLHVALARLLLREERYQDAVRTLQAVLGSSPAFPGAGKLLARAEALLRGEDPDAAEADSGAASPGGAAEA